MELGTIFCNNKLYNLNFIGSEEIANLLKLKLSKKEYAILRRIYEYKISKEIINLKIYNQLNVIQIEINQINSKFITLPKNYSLIKEEVEKIESEYEKILRKISYKYDIKIEKNILKLLKNENKLIRLKKKDIEKINKIKDENKEYINKINGLSDEKVKKITDAMESEEKRMSTKIIKPKNFVKITRFFANKFNTYNVITKNVLNPIQQRIEDYLSKNINIYDIDDIEFCLEEFETKVNEILKQK